MNDFFNKIPIVAPTPTPFTNDEVNYEKLSNNIEKWHNTSISGFVLGSHGGEELHTSIDEKRQIIDTVVETNNKQKVIIAGIETPSPKVALNLIDDYASRGVDFVRIRIPGRFKKGSLYSESVVKYFENILSDSALPVIVIHQPRTSLEPDVSPEELSVISEIEGIVAYIISLNFRWETVIPKIISKKIYLWTCNGSLLFPGASIGATGACLFFGIWAPEKCREIIKLTLNGNSEEAISLQKNLISADYIGMSRGVGALKYGLNLLGYDATVPRLPTKPLSKDDQKLLKSAFKDALILD